MRHLPAPNRDRCALCGCTRMVQVLQGHDECPVRRDYNNMRGERWLWEGSSFGLSWVVLKREPNGVAHVWVRLPAAYYGTIRTPAVTPSEITVDARTP